MDEGEKREVCLAHVRARRVCVARIAAGEGREGEGASLQSAYQRISDFRPGPERAEREGVKLAANGLRVGP